MTLLRGNFSAYVQLYEKRIQNCIHLAIVGLFFAFPGIGAGKQNQPVVGHQKNKPKNDSVDNQFKKPRRHRWVYDNLFAVRVAPLGLVNRYRVGHRLQLINRDSILFRDSSVNSRIDSSLSPTFGSIGPSIEIMPVAVLRLGASYQWIGYFGNFSNILSYVSQEADHSRAVRMQEKRAGEHYATSGHQVFLNGLLQGKIGPVIARGEVIMRWTKLCLRNGDRVFYDPLVDTLVPNKGWTLLLDADLLVSFAKDWIIGVRYSLVEPLYQKAHFTVDGDQSSLNGPISRLGPAALYQFVVRPGAVFRPSIFAIVQWHIGHRYRTGKETSAALPMMIAGFSFSGDLWPKH